MDAVDIDVENLFNDGQLDQILPTEHNLQPATLVPGLAEHFLNSQFSGGFSRVSWSRQGHIAVISDDGSTVSVHCLRSSTKDQTWTLSKSRPLDTIFENAVHVRWSPSGYDLAIVDSRGRIAIHSMTTTCLNRLNESKAALTDEPEELGMPIGTWWFNQDRSDKPRNIVASSTRGPDKWTHNMAKVKALGPLYPRAFCTVNRQGVLSLTYQRPGARYTRTSVNLPLRPNTICSHAAFSPTVEGKILLAIYTSAGDLSVYHVQVVWPQDLMTDPTSSSRPDLIIETIDNCVSMWTDNDGASNSLTQGYKPDEWALTHINIVPTSDMEAAVREPPCIWAVFTLTNPAVNANSEGFVVNSIIRRWQVHPITRTLHPIFDDIPSKTEPSGGDEQVFAVERSRDLVLPQVVTTIELTDSGQMVAISTADGRTELWNPVTQALVSYEGQTDEITSLEQFGFAYNASINSVTTTLSPNACSSLTLTEELKPFIQHVQDPVQTSSQEIDLTDPHQSAAVAAVVLAFARSCWSNTNGDDVLACVRSNYTPQQYVTIVSEMYRTLFRDTEFIHEKAPDTEAERVVSKPIATKVLSFQMSLLHSAAISATSSDENVRHAALSSLWSWVALNLRYTTTTLYIFWREYQANTTASQNPDGPQPPALSPSFIDAICNTIRWVLDLFRLIFITILEIGDRNDNPSFFETPKFANNLGDSVGDGSQGLVSLILNCQWTRSFLCAISRAMRELIKSNERGHNALINRVVHTIRRYSVNKGMQLSAIDKLLDPRWYVRNGLRNGEDMDNATIARRQIAMCSSGRVEPEYAGTLRTLLDKLINDPTSGLKATSELVRLKLWTETPDLNWLFLGFQDQFYRDGYVAATNSHAPLSSSNNSSVKLTLYDVHRKASITVSNDDQLIRRCVRCGCVSGDVDGIDKSWSKAMVTHLARCVCDAYWILERVGGDEPA